MPPLVIGGITVRATGFQREEDERGGSDWARGNWSVSLYIADDADLAAFRAAVSADTPRTYVRAINGALMGGPLIACSGDLGVAASCGVELGAVTAVRERASWYWLLPVRLREA